MGEPIFGPYRGIQLLTYPLPGRGRKFDPSQRANTGLQEADPLKDEDHQSGQAGECRGRDELEIELEGDSDHWDLKGGRLKAKSSRSENREIPGLGTLLTF